MQGVKIRLPDLEHKSLERQSLERQSLERQSLERQSLERTRLTRTSRAELPPVSTHQLSLSDQVSSHRVLDRRARGARRQPQRLDVEREQPEEVPVSSGGRAGPRVADIAAAISSGNTDGIGTRTRGEIGS